MAQDHGNQAQLHAHANEKHQQGKSSDNSGKNQREKDETPEQSFSGKLRAVQRQGRWQTKTKRDDHGDGCDNHAVEYGIPKSRVCEKLAIPVESPAGRGKSSDARAIERINNQNDDGEIQEEIDE